MAARVQALADAAEIHLTREVHDAPSLATLLTTSFAVEAGTARLKGVGQEMPVFQVQPRTTVRAE